MHPSPPSSGTGSPDPPTPDSYVSTAPAIVSPDEFTFQIGLQLDKIVGSPPTSHLLPQSSVPDPCFLSGDDISKAQVFLRNRGRWGNMHDRFESALPAPCSPRDGASDDFSWEAARSALGDPVPSRYSLLIHEVSLLVGLNADDDHLSPDDGFPLVPDPPIQVHDILPLSLTPTKSLTSGKHRNAGLPHTNVPHPSILPIPPSIANNADPSLHYQGPPPVGSRDLAMPIPRHRSADAARPSLSPRRRQGQVFHLEPPLSNAPHRNTVGLDETFCHPRKPPPRPTQKPPANRCSSLDRLESSLLKLEAHAPHNHRKSQSEGRSSDHVSQSKVTRPSLPPPRRLLRQQQSSYEIIHRKPPRPAHDHHFSGLPPVPSPILPHQYVAPRICPAVLLDNDHFKEDLTPGSFMDMDIPHMEEDWQKRRTSFRQVKGKVKMKSLVNVAKRVSRGVIAWGKNLTGSAKPLVTAQEMTVQSAHV